MHNKEFRVGRTDGRATDEMRPVKMLRRFQRYAAGSCLIEVGATKVVCAATVENTVPKFLKGTLKSAGIYLSVFHKNAHATRGNAWQANGQDAGNSAAHRQDVKIGDGFESFRRAYVAH